jgi:1-acyl-sn-glycerol-3-phosphate acyltransferase
MTFGEPVSVEGLEATPEDAATAIGQAWPQIEREYAGWQARPGVMVAAAAAIGLGALVASKRRKH